MRPGFRLVPCLEMPRNAAACCAAQRRRTSAPQPADCVSADQLSQKQGSCTIQYHRQQTDLNTLDL